jgi:lysophospholipase L1-like esterase
VTTALATASGRAWATSRPLAALIACLLAARPTAGGPTPLPFPFARNLLGLESGEARVVRVLHFGDSHIASGPEAGILGSALRQLFGDGGAGLGLPWTLPRYQVRDGLRSGCSRGWTRVAWQAGDPPRAASLVGAYLETFQPGEMAWIEGEGEHFRLSFLRQPAGGSIEVRRDGLHVEAVSLVGPQGIGELRLVAPTAGPHRWELRTTARGAVRLLGAALEGGRGVAYSPLGQNGATIDMLLACEDRTFRELLQIERPDLVILAFGTNEAGDPRFDAVAYEALVDRILARFRDARPETGLLVVGPPDRGDRPPGTGVVSAVSRALARASAGAGALFVDRLTGMGGPGSAVRWAAATPPLAQADRVHFTAQGYTRLAGMVLEDLLGAFNRTKASPSFRSSLRLREPQAATLLAAAERPTPSPALTSARVGGTRATAVTRQTEGGVVVVRDAEGRVRITNLAAAAEPADGTEHKLGGGPLGGGKK